MWAIAGVLLGMVAVTFLSGFHFGPHAHAASTTLGVSAAVVLVILACTGHADPLLFTLLGADVAVTGAVGVIATKGFSQRALLAGAPTDNVTGSFATAIDTLDPDGTVRLRGEVWSATALNPPIHAGTSVHVVHRSSVRLEVWGDTGQEAESLFGIEPASATAADRDEGLATRSEPDHPATAGAGEERTPET